MLHINCRLCGVGEVIIKKITHTKTGKYRVKYKCINCNGSYDFSHRKGIKKDLDRLKAFLPNIVEA